MLSERINPAEMTTKYRLRIRFLAVDLSDIVVFEFSIEENALSLRPLGRKSQKAKTGIRGVVESGGTRCR